MTEAHIDLETRSAADLRKVGVYRYAQHPTTSCIVACYAIDENEVQTWWPHMPVPTDLKEVILSGSRLYAHNSSFERVMIKHMMAKLYGWPVPRDDQWHCTAAMAAAMALPRDLERLALALTLPHQKDMAGNRVIKQIMKPRHVADDGTITWWDDEARLQKAAAYCADDVRVERDAAHKLFPLSDYEREIFLLDARINDRGIRVDVPVVMVAAKMVESELARLDAEMAETTMWRVTSATQVARLTEFLNVEGVKTESLDKASIKELLARDDLPPWCRRAIEIRKQAGKSSTAKLRALLTRVSADDILRENLLYHGASTGRWSGRGAQLQNLPRPEKGYGKPEDAIEAIAIGNQALVELMFGPVLNVVSNCLRQMLIAREGNDLLAVDFANIEGRVLCWLAGEAWKIRAFEDYDAGVGPDLYKVAAARIYGKPHEAIDDAERQVGKVSELACLAGDTPVLTRSGVKPLLYVTVEDQVWDGAAWVKHGGLVMRGRRKTIALHSLRLTADHLVLSEGHWQIAAGLDDVRRADAVSTATRSLPSDNDIALPGGVQFYLYDAPESEVYDLVNAGPRHRFTVFTTHGPLIVHNCGYQGGVGAFQKMAALYGLTVSDEQADEIKTAWRAANPNIKALWRKIEDAALLAVKNPGAVVECGRVAYLMRSGFLWCRLPSGRCLAYAAAAIREMVTPWGWTELKEWAEVRKIEVYGRDYRSVKQFLLDHPEVPEDIRYALFKPAVSYMGVDATTHQWSRQFAYGGLFCENVVQAVSRDLLAEAMLNVEEKYPVILTVHDEIVSEVPKGFGDLEEFKRLACDKPAWAEGCPVASAGWRGRRYRK